MDVFEVPLIHVREHFAALEREIEVERFLPMGNGFGLMMAARKKVADASLRARERGAGFGIAESGAVKGSRLARGAERLRGFWRRRFRLIHLRSA